MKVITEHRIVLDPGEWIPYANGDDVDHVATVVAHSGPDGGPGGWSAYRRAEAPNVFPVNVTFTVSRDPEAVRRIAELVAALR